MKIKTLNLAATELDPGRFPSAPWPEIAVSGRSNVGKSSLMNRLLGRKNIARVSKEPGKTRTVNFFLINDSFYLVDLPGYGYARVSRDTRGSWHKVIFDYVEEREKLAGVIQLVDARHSPTKDDLMMIQRLVDAEREFLVVFTKSDKIGRNERARTLREFKSFFDGFTIGPFESATAQKSRYDIHYVFTSSKTGEGKDEVWKWIGSLL